MVELVIAMQVRGLLHLVREAADVEKTVRVHRLGMQAVVDACRAVSFGRFRLDGERWVTFQPACLPP